MNCTETFSREYDKYGTCHLKFMDEGNAVDIIRKTVGNSDTKKCAVLVYNVSNDCITKYNDGQTDINTHARFQKNNRQDESVYLIKNGSNCPELFDERGYASDVVSGGVRRSSMISLSCITNDTFQDVNDSIILNTLNCIKCFDPDYLHTPWVATILDKNSNPDHLSV